MANALQGISPLIRRVVGLYIAALIVAGGLLVTFWKPAG